MSLKPIRSALALACALAVSGSVQGGVFLNQTAGKVTHAGAYNGTGGERVVNVCLDPTAMPVSGDPTQATENVIAEYNRFQATLGNVLNAVAQGVPSGVDYESILMHEMGHCLGLDHNVLGPSEVGCTVGGSCVNSPTLFFVNTAPNIGTVNAGLDAARGTGDDVRNVANRHWYRANNNNPFVEAPTADRTTYVQSGSLPLGELYAEAVANFSPCVQGSATSNTGLANGQPATQDVMFPILCTNNVVRDLSPNDRTTFRIARAGLDGAAGTGDDYTVRLNFQGIDQNGCDIQIRFPSGGGFFCSVGLLGWPNGDSSVSDNNLDVDLYAGIINLQRETNWFFNQNDTTGGAPVDALYCNGFEDNSGVCD